MNNVQEQETVSAIKIVYAGLHTLCERKYILFLLLIYIN